MCKFKDLTNELGFTYLDRFYEKLAFRLGENIGVEISSIETMNMLAQEMSYTDDGYLYFLVEQEHPIDPSEDLKFMLTEKTSDGYYYILADNEKIGACDSLSSVIKGCIEDFFM